MTGDPNARRTATAYFAISVAPLTGNAKAVAGAILSHHNRRTGQCDPSIARIATLLGIDRATVLRATAELCDGEKPLFVKSSHGGKSRRASYAPCWRAFEAIAEDWNERMKSGAAPAAKVAKLRPSRSQNCDVDGRRTATQTLIGNPCTEPVAVEGHAPPAPKPKPEPPLRKARKRPQDQRQGWLLLPIAGKGPGHAEAALQAAHGRIDRDMRAKWPPGVYAAVVEATTGDAAEEAARAEMARRGAGAELLLARAGMRGAP